MIRDHFGIGPKKISVEINGKNTPLPYAMLTDDVIDKMCTMYVNHSEIEFSIEPAENN
jgi:hypothetical protein